MKNLISTLFLLLFITSISSQNLLTNGGFETWSAGKPTAWSITNARYTSQSTLQFNEGGSSLKCNTYQINKLVSIAQSKLVTPGKSYRMSVSYFVEYGDGTDVKISMYFRTSNNKAIPLALEDSLALKGPGGNTAWFQTDLGVWKTYSCDVIAPPTASNFYFRVQSAPYSISYWDNFSFSENLAPTTYLSKTSLVNFNYASGAGPSAAQTFTVKGVNLSSNITVAAPADYEISTSTSTGYTNSISLSPINGTVASTTIYTRLKSGLALGTYNENITVSATGVANQSVSLIGSVGAPPIVINSSVSSISVFTYNLGNGPSPIFSFSVSGSGLTNALSIAASSNYEISFKGGSLFTGISSTSIAQSGGSVANTILYVRLKSGLTAGNYNGTITLSSSGSSKVIALTGVVTESPILTYTPASLSNFRYELGNGPSTAQTVTIGGTLLVGNILVTAPTNYEVAPDNSSPYSTSITLPATGGVVAPTTVYVRLKADLLENGYSGLLTISSPTAVTQEVTLAGVVASNPKLEASTLSLSEFTYRLGNGPSNEQKIFVSGIGLGAAVFVTAPTDYVISLDSLENFAPSNQLYLGIANGILAQTPIFIKLDGDLPEGEYNESLTITSGSVTPTYVALYGAVTGLPAINFYNLPLSSLTYVVGTGPSLPQSFDMSGSWLTSDVTVAPPVGFELSTDQNNWVKSPSKLTLSPNSGTLASATIYVRMEGGLNVGNYSGEIQVTTNEIAPQTITLTGDISIATNFDDAQMNKVQISSYSSKIMLANLLPNTTIRLFSSSGKLVTEQIATNSSIILEVKEKGIYMLRINDNVEKVVVK